MIKEKRRGLPLEGVVLMYDNAQPHTAMLTTSLLADFKWDIFHHPYIPFVPGNQTRSDVKGADFLRSGSCRSQFFEIRIFD